MSPEERAIALLDLLESDFGQSGKDVRFLAIRDELRAAYRLGLTRAAEIAAATHMCPECGGYAYISEAILTERDKSRKS